MVKSHHRIAESVEQVRRQRAQGSRPSRESQLSLGGTEIPARFQQPDGKERHRESQQNPHDNRT